MVRLGGWFWYRTLRRAFWSAFGASLLFLEFRGFNSVGWVWHTIGRELSRDSRTMQVFL